MSGDRAFIPHVVCRDCDLEDRSEAKALWEEHGDGTDHQVKYAGLRVDDVLDEAVDGAPTTGEARQ